MHSSVAQDVEHPSEVSVEWEPGPAGRGTLRFQHGGWTPENASVRHKFGDCAILLAADTALADGTFARSRDRSA